MALNRAQHVIEHIDSIKEAVVRYKYNIFIPGMKKKKGGVSSEICKWQT